MTEAKALDFFQNLHYNIKYRIEKITEKENDIMRVKHGIGKAAAAVVLAAVLLTGCSNGVNESAGESVGSVSEQSSNTASSVSSVSSSLSAISSANSSAASSTTSSAVSSASTSESKSESKPESVEESKPESKPESVEESKPESKPEETSVPSQSGETDKNTPYGKHGALSVKGTDLVGASGEKVQLRGMSTHGLAWFPQYVNYDTFKFLRDDWNTNCVRLAMYTHENGGYCAGGNKEQLKTLVKNGVDYASQLGMYVIVDWHVLNEQSPLVYKDEAKKFFEEMSKQFADKDNVIYEICNEPNSSASWQDVTTYANEIIPIIRANDPNSVILVGTPQWSQNIDQALSAPLNFDNIMYTLHFYAATHTDWLRNKMESCINSGLPVFVSEFGTCDASGNGAVDVGQSNAWKDIIEKHNVSYMCWNLANKNESSCIIVSGCSKLYGWSDGELSTQGKWIRDWFKSETEM